MDLARYLGVPWRAGGRDASGADCWGIVRMVLADHGVHVPTYGPLGAMPDDAVADAIARAAPLPPWQATVLASEARPLDVVVMRGASGEADHIGIVVAPGRVLHMTAGRSPVVAALDGPIRRRVVSIHRHEALA